MVNVAGEGKNDPQCGKREEPCRSISYVVDKLLPFSCVLHIQLLSPVTEATGMVIRRELNITVEGSSMNSPVLSVLDEFLFSVDHPKVVFSFKNLDIRVKKMLVKFECFHLSKVNLGVHLINSILQRIEKSQPHKLMDI